jgi:hypothetical protein
VTMTVEEAKPAASLTAASVKRGITADLEADAIPESSFEAGGEEPNKVRGALIFGVIYVGALLIFAAAFDVWSAVLG